MNWEDVLEKGEDGVVGELQQDEWSLHGGADGGPPTFGKDGQLKVVGHNGGKRNRKFYILECSVCSQDSELFGEGLFRSLKSCLRKGRIPCRCSIRPKWTQEQFSVLCTRKAQEIGYTFNGFVGEWKGQYTKISLTCEKHGEWNSGIIDSLISKGCGCALCWIGTNTKPDHVMIASFLSSGAFHPDTKFWRSERKNSQGYAAYWHVHCPECGEEGESTSGSLQKGCRPCACSIHRQQECYINWIVDDFNNAVAIKFGIARDSKQRVKDQNRQSIYEVRNYLTYTFPDVSSCKKAERECKKQLICGVVSKTDMPDGFTETTCTSNLARVKSIFESNGGVLVN